MNQAVMPTYGRLPVTFEHGAGQWLWDTQGKKYLDGLGGIAVCVLGHAHPRVAEVIREQAGKLLHTSNLYAIGEQERLADKLSALSGMQNMFFGNSGAEANEAAIKIARAYGHARDIDEPAIIVTNGAFHGRTLATLSATGNPKVHAGFEPLVSGFVRVDFDDLDAVGEQLAKNADIVAVFVEPIQGEGGIVVPQDGYLRGLRELCDAHECLLMLDEVQTAQGRTGRWFGWQHENIRPDVMTLAKGLANGIPIGACLANGPAAAVLKAGMHGSTFGGNPFCCAVANVVLDVIEGEGLVEHAHARGERVRQQVTSRFESSSESVKLRGKGMMIGVELDRPCTDLVTMAMERGALINVTADRVVRLLPGINMTGAEVDQLAEIVCDSIAAFHNR